MTLILGILTSLIAEVIKKVKARYGEELGTKLVYGVIFLISIIWTILTTYNLISPEAITKVLTIVATAVATYEIIIKRVASLLPTVGSDKKGK